MSFTRIFSGLALLAGLTLAAEARAEDNDEKVYTANFCRAVSGSITYGNYGAISNASTTADLVVECPIVRDNTESSVDFVDVLIRDRNVAANEDVSCVLRERRENGSTEESDPYVTPGGDGLTGPSSYEEITLFLDSAGPDSWDAQTNAGLILRCTIPPSTVDGTSWMFMYEIQEN